MPPTTSRSSTTLRSRSISSFTLFTLSLSTYHVSCKGTPNSFGSSPSPVAHSQTSLSQLVTLSQVRQTPSVQAPAPIRVACVRPQRPDCAHAQIPWPARHATTKERVCPCSNVHREIKAHLLAVTNCWAPVVILIGFKVHLQNYEVVPTERVCPCSNVHREIKAHLLAGTKRAIGRWL
jgi:hypothetical protein